MSIRFLPFRTRMSIRTKLKASGIITICLALTVGLTALMSSRNIKEAARNERFSSRVIKDVSDLSSLSYAYLLLKDKRPGMQWQLKHTSLGKVLAEHMVRSPEELALLARLRSNHEQLKRLYDVVSAGAEETRTGEYAFSPYDELNEGVTAQLMASAEMMANDASSLGRLSARHMDTVRRVSLYLVVASAIVLILSAAVTTFLLARSIGGSIRVLEQGTRRIAAGDLGYSVPIAGSDEISHLSQAFNDMTAKLKTSYGRLEQKNRELQEFAFIASHDLGEPLRKIQTFGDLLKAKGSAHLGEMELDYISRMTGAAARMQELLDALLRYSRVETHGRDFVPVKLEDIVQTVTTDLEVSIKKTGAVVEIGALPVIDGDPYQWRQLFQNLVANALKYHRSEVKPHIKVFGEEAKGTCRIFVEDNGIGFDEKYLDKIFQPFQRLHGRNEYPGTGIGLAICRKIVDRHHGTITATSAPGKGSTFIVTLPSKQGTKAENTP